MDIFKIDIPSAYPLNWPGTLIEGLTSKLWVERYRDPGEFTLVGPIGPVGPGKVDLKKQLPLGSFITHIDTQKVMIVENHQISRSQEDNTRNVTITGRSLETFFENRTLVQGFGGDMGDEFDYIYLPGVQKEEMGLTCIAEPLDIQILNMFDLGKDNSKVTIVSQISAPSNTAVEREVPWGSLYSGMISLLQIEDIGWKSLRPGKNPISGQLADHGFVTRHTSDVPDGQIAIVLYKGTDVSSNVHFSYSEGDLETCDYLWSNKSQKNGVMLNASWAIGVLTPTDKLDFDRKMIYVEDYSINSKYKSEPSGGENNAIKTKMDRKMREIVDTKIETSIANVSLSKDIKRYKYRTDYDLGDIVYIRGDFGINQKMRVIEYAEFEDSSGKGGYPTLTGLRASDA